MLTTGVLFTVDSFPFQVDCSIFEEKPGCLCIPETFQTFLTNEDLSSGAIVAKLSSSFSANLWTNKLGCFYPDRPFIPSLVFASKARSLPEIYPLGILLKV